MTEALEVVLSDADGARPASMANTSRPPGTNQEKSFMKMGLVLSTHRW